jgi:phosphoribulokinase
LGITTTVFIKKFTEKAAEDTYELTKSILKYLSSESSKTIKLIASKLYITIKKRARTYIVIGFPYPNSWFNTSMKIRAKNEKELLEHISIFAIYADKIYKEIEEVTKQYGKPSTGFFIKLIKNKSICISWNDPKTLTKIEKHIKSPF